MINKDKIWKLEILSFIQDRLGWVKFRLGCLARKTECFSRFDPKKFEFSRLNYWLVVA